MTDPENTLPEWIISAASQQHVSAIIHLLEPFFEQQYLLRRTPDELEKLVEHAFVATNATELVGFAAVEVYSRKMAEIQCLAVAPDCVQRARQLGVTELMAITSSDELFIKCGFHYSLPNQKKALFITP